MCSDGSVCARILVYKYLYRNARCPRRTTQLLLLLLLMPAAGIYTASAICCHCRYNSCRTTYFNIMFFDVIVITAVAIFDCSAVHLFVILSCTFFHHSPVILSSFQQIYFSFCLYSVLPHTMSVGLSFCCRFSVCSYFFLLFCLVFVAQFVSLCIYLYSSSSSSSSFSLLFCDSTYFKCTHCCVCVAAISADAVRHFSQLQFLTSN